MINLLEETRTELINKSKNVDIVKAYDATRYQRRVMQKEFTNLNSYNKIDMTALFVSNLLSFIIPVHGETADYNVEILFEKICDDIKEELKRNHYKLEYKCIYKALINALNRQDILISCTCSDFKFRFAYEASKGGFNAGYPEIRPARITNPRNSKGTACKHALLVLSNLSWAINLATTIFNYIKYMQKHDMPRFVKIIYPAIFDIPYDDWSEDQNQYAVGDNELANTMDREEDKEILDNANKEVINDS